MAYPIRDTRCARGDYLDLRDLGAGGNIPDGKEFQEEERVPHLPGIDGKEIRRCAYEREDIDRRGR